MAKWHGAVQASKGGGCAIILEASGSVVLTGTLYGISTGALTFRIPTVDVPQGAQKCAATITPTIVLGSGSESGFVNVFARLVPDVPALVIGLLGEPRTTSHVTEIPAAGTVPIDITAVVQEIVDRPGWVAGNAIAILMTQAPGRAVSARHYDGSPSYAATVSVTWSEAAPPGAQVREIVATTVGAQPSVPGPRDHRAHRRPSPGARHSAGLDRRPVGRRGPARVARRPVDPHTPLRLDR